MGPIFKVNNVNCVNASATNFASQRCFALIAMGKAKKKEKKADFTVCANKK